MQDSRTVLILNLGSTDQRLLRSRNHIIRETNRHADNINPAKYKWEISVKRNHTSLLKTLKRYTRADNYLISKEAHIYIIKLIK